VAGPTTQPCARQFLEHALGAAERRSLIGADYRLAANLRQLRAAARAWHHRYTARPQSQLEQAAAEQIRSGDVVESGHAGRGTDGAHYARAYSLRSGKHAVVITASARDHGDVRQPVGGHELLDYRQHRLGLGLVVLRRRP